MVVRRASYRKCVRSYPIPSSDIPRDLTCFKCGKVGHRAVNCYTNRQLPYKKRTNCPNAQKRITCFNCGDQEHKSPDCPKHRKNRAVTLAKHKQNSSSAGLAHMDDENTLVLGQIKGNSTWFKLDTCASLSVIPRKYVKNHG